MDRNVIEYLSSGNAWLLVGSGPSIAAGYPTWRELAEAAAQLVDAEGDVRHAAAARAKLDANDYPAVFQVASDGLGLPRLLEQLRERLHRRGGDSSLYGFIARWPVAVYLTTNYDDELSRHLQEEPYLVRSNSEPHMELLVSDTRGLIAKLHGDLSSPDGLILTTAQYKAVTEAEEWRYWRNKLQSIFQMQPVVVVGHSLTDANVRHVLAAAKIGSGVHQPVCWIAPEIPQADVRRYLEDFRIRVIPYDNSDGRHGELAATLRQISQFVPPRVSVHIRDQIARVAGANQERSSAATAYLVFNRLSRSTDYEVKRRDVILAALESALPQQPEGEFELGAALETAGWPRGATIDPGMTEAVIKEAEARGLIVRRGRTLGRGRNVAEASSNRAQFEVARERFLESLKFRLRRDYKALPRDRVEPVAEALDAALTGYFREGGLTLATALMMDRRQESPLPTSIIEFVTEASAQFSTLVERRAFSGISIDIFVRAESAERQYLGRLSQGFLAFHCLGAFGEIARERWGKARDTVWLIDSNVLIPALALAAPTNPTVSEALSTLKQNGVRLFTTWQLYREMRSHLRFAQTMIRTYGPDSGALIAVATGQDPRYRSNQFLEGFIRWRSAGNPPDWDLYLAKALGASQPEDADLIRRLSNAGVETVKLDAWPGYASDDLATREDLTDRVKDATLALRREIASSSSDYDEEVLENKARPEAEALLVINCERGGRYHMLSDIGIKSPAWFISSTSLLNLVSRGETGDATSVTWQPEAFLGFVSTLLPEVDKSAADGAFERLLWNIARSGLTLLDEQTVQSVFGGIIDEATLALADQRDLYDATLASKYGEAPELVMARMRPSARPLAAVQLQSEMSQVRERQVKALQLQSRESEKRARRAEAELGKVERYRARLKRRESRIAKRRRAQGRGKGR